MADLLQFGSGRGRLARATHTWAKAIRERENVPPSALVLIALAGDAAKLADAARLEGDGRLYLAAATRLQQLLARVDRMVSGDGDVGAGESDEWARGMAELMGSGPSVGDA